MTDQAARERPERRSHLLLIGGRSGVGKTTTATAIHDLLASSRVKHAVIEGDYLDLAWPAPHEAFASENLADRNLRAMWSNYRELGYRRLVLTNTAVVAFPERIAAAMGDDPVVTSVLLQASDEVAAVRLGARALGASVESELERSIRAAVWLQQAAPPATIRIDTDSTAPGDLARQIAHLAGWVGGETL